ncbi:MAG: hypothetical protein QM737_19390 [Ferruginibacter sp.]
MILILSEERDIATDSAMEWLNHFKQKVIRINCEDVDVIKYFAIGSKSLKIQFRQSELNIAAIKSTWFRRGQFVFSSNFSAVSNKDNNVKAQVLKQIQNEVTDFSDFVYKLLLEKKCISTPFQYNTNKLESLYLANKVGLEIPYTYIVNNKNDLTAFSGKKEQLITKSISNNHRLEINNKVGSIGTTTAKHIPQKFFFSLFQSKIERYCEIRVFFIKDHFFPMAIFVDKRIVDGRALLNQFGEARMVPFKLPVSIINKLKKLCKLKNLNTGSIDLIFTAERKFIFLEINPVGQYDYLECYTNYPISRTIAKLLMHD